MRNRATGPQPLVVQPSPLHQLSDQVARSSVYLYEPRDTYRLQGGPRRRSGNTNTFRDGENGAALDWDRVGEDAPVGAVISYYLASEPAGDIALEILEGDGTVVKKFTSKTAEEENGIPTEKGMNRFVWDLRYPDADIIPNTSFRGTTRGPVAVPGRYQVRLTAEGESQTRSFQLLKDPRVPSTQADLEEQFDLLIQIRDGITETYDAIKAIRDLKEQIDKAAEGAETGVKRAGEELAQKLTAVEHELIEPRIEYREDCWNFPSKLNHFWSYLAQKVGSGDYKPTDAEHERFRELRGMLEEQMGRLKRLIASDVATFNDMLKGKGLQPLVPKLK